MMHTKSYGTTLVYRHNVLQQTKK